MKDQLIVTALFQENAKGIQQNPSIAPTINMDFWAPECQDVHDHKMCISDHVISLSTELHGPQHLVKYLCATDLNWFWKRQGLWQSAAEDNCWIHREIS